MTELTATAADRLEVRGLQVHAHHGVFASERRDGQVFVIDLALFVDSRPAAATDDLSHTVDYASLVADVVAAAENDPVDLIETLAERIADVCLVRERVGRVEVTVHKPEAPVEASFGDIALTINRSRK